MLYSDAMKDLFIAELMLAKKKYDFKLIHFCIMSNHVHLILEPGPDSDLSRIMQLILSGFARRFNSIYGKTGHVWYDRFKSIIIRSFDQFVNTFHYISDNPVKAGMCKNAGNYIYSGLYELRRKFLRVMDPPDEWLKLIL